MESDDKNKIVLVDDHKLFRKGMVELINRLSNYKVIWEANHGKDFIEQVNYRDSPDIVLLDITMPQLDGYATAAWIKQYHPKIKILALSMYDDEHAIIKMIKSGARGYILKDADPSELKQALQDVIEKGFYHSELVTGILFNTVSGGGENGNKDKVKLNDREIEFLNLACSEYTYKEIADKMCLSVRTIDGYRESLFEKLEVRSRTGMVLYAIKFGLVKV